MDSTDSSNHLCLVCNQTVIGLMNYVEHFKSHVIPQSAPVSEEAAQTKEPVAISNTSQSCVTDSYLPLMQPDTEQPEQQTESPKQQISQSCNFVETGLALNDSDLESENLLSPQHSSSFFQSLELKNANEERTEKPRVKAVQRLLVLEDDAQAESLLPITSILSNLEFSSDEDFMGVLDNEGDVTTDQSLWLNNKFKFGSSKHPAPHHTGGKWRPGERPLGESLASGKQKLNRRPGPACRKILHPRSTRLRAKQRDAGKTFYCNVCLASFPDRNSYTQHFSQAKHKEIAASKKQSKVASEYLEDTEVNRKSAEDTEVSRKSAEDTEVSRKSAEDTEVSRVPAAKDALKKAETSREEAAGVPIKEPSQTVGISEIKPRRGGDACYCPVCVLYFDNDLVFATHCETKQHKESLLKYGFREYRGKNGTVLVVDVQNDTVYTDRQENMWSALDTCKKSQNATDGCTPEEEHSCHLCQKNFARKYEMARHLLTRMHRNRALKHPEAESVDMLNKYNKYMIRLSPFQCGLCQYYFNRQKDFMDHMCSTSHLVTCQDMLGSLLCVTCQFTTYEHDEMMLHLQQATHFASVERRQGICIVRESHSGIICKFCGLKMHSAVRMKRHCQKRHRERLTQVQVTMDVKPVEYIMFNCPLCQKSFRTKNLLQLHFLRIHKNKSVFNCSACNRGFLDQRRLDNHLRTTYHAKRVVAHKLKAMGHIKAASLRKAAVFIGRKKRDEGLANKRENIIVRMNFKTSKQKEPEKATLEKPEIVVAGPCRRSPRNRRVATVVSSQDFVSDLDVTSHKTMKVKSFLKSGRRKIEMSADTDWSAGSDKSSQHRKSTRMLKFQTLHKASAGADLTSKEICTSSNVDVATTPFVRKRGRPRLNRDIEKTPRLLKSRRDDHNSTVSHGSKDTVDEGFLTNTVTRSGTNSSVSAHLKLDNEDEDYGNLFESTAKDADLDRLDEETVNEASRHIFSCTYCDYAATDLLGLRGHYMESHPNDILTCQPCNQYFLSLKAYKIHCCGRGHQLKLREETGESRVHKCQMCDKRFLQEQCCQLHMETVHRHASCEADLQRIHQGQDLVTQLYGDHVKQVESLNNDTSVSCPECGKFVRKDTLVEHLRLHTGEKPYICRFCNKGFAGRLTLRRHISSHLNMPTFICDLCGKEFKRSNLLVQHIRQHDLEKKGEKHTCHVCQAWFYTPEELARHMRRHGDRNYKCTWPGCHWTFVLRGELNSHMFTHTGEKKYLCDLCGFGAPTKTRLRRHNRIHDKSRTITCDYCPYKAICKTHLKRHMRIHTNARPFICPYCSYTCNTHENIRKHILKTQKHKGLKLYPCKLCNQFGSDSSRDFKAHLMTTHSDYLKENAIDSLSVFSGLYKREEDFNKPQEGSEIVQVTKGRFFRSYQNPNALVEPSKPKKSKKLSKAEEVKVNSFNPWELVVSAPVIASNDNQQEEAGVTDSHQPEEVGHHQPPEQQAQHMFLAQEDPLQSDHKQGIQEPVVTSVELPHYYIKVPSVVMQPGYNQQVQTVSSSMISFTPSLIQEPQPSQTFSLNLRHLSQQPSSVQSLPIKHLQQSTQLLPLPTSALDNFHQSAQLLPISQAVRSLQEPAEQVPATVNDEKVFWAVVPNWKTEPVGFHAPVTTQEPWYSHLPQVHAPTTQELQQYRTVEMPAINNSPYPSNPPYAYKLPVSDITNISGDHVYASVTDNVVILNSTSNVVNTADL